MYSYLILCMFLSFMHAYMYTRYSGDVAKIVNVLMKNASRVFNGSDLGKVSNYERRNMRLPRLICSNVLCRNY